MASSGIQRLGTFALALSLLIFAAFFLNVLVGGPMNMKPWLDDVGEMLTLFAAVVFFVIGTICRETETYANGRREDVID